MNIETAYRKTRRTILAITLAPFVFVSPIFGDDDCEFEYSLLLEETRELSFDPEMEYRDVIVSNYNGSIHVEGYDGDTVLLEIERHISARNESRLNVAQEEVQLEIKEEGDAIILYVDAPFRKGDGHINHKGCRYYGYKNRFDLRLRIPHSADIYLQTTTGGDIEVTNTSGRFDVRNVNGSIVMRGTSGSGKAQAINEGVNISFDKNPDSDCFFGSLNGTVQVEFQPELDADLYFKTMNGEIYSDFKVARIPPIETKGATAKKRDGTRIYNISESSGVRVGKGGPKLEFDTLNGNMIVKKLNTNN